MISGQGSQLSAKALRRREAKNKLPANTFLAQALVSMSQDNQLT